MTLSQAYRQLGECLRMTLFEHRTHLSFSILPYETKNLGNTSYRNAMNIVVEQLFF